MNFSKIIILIFTLTTINCSDQNNKRAYQKIDYDQEGFILFDFLKYYKEDFDSYPVSLEEVSKLFSIDTIDYSGVNKSNIKANIRDPFSEQNYKYVLLDERSFILYSVGQDGIDNNSNVLEKYKKSGKINFFHYDKSSSNGDILIYHLKNGEIINDFTDVSKLK